MYGSRTRCRDSRLPRATVSQKKCTVSPRDINRYSLSCAAAAREGGNNGWVIESSSRGRACARYFLRYFAKTSRCKYARARVFVIAAGRDACFVFIKCVRRRRNRARMRAREDSPSIFLDNCAKRQSMISSEEIRRRRSDSVIFLDAAFLPRTAQVRNLACLSIPPSQIHKEIPDQLFRRARARARARAMTMIWDKSTARAVLAWE